MEAVSVKAYHRVGNVRLYNARFEEVLPLIASGKVEACITDPPYAREHKPLWSKLAAELPRALTLGGSFLSIVPHYLIPDVCNIVGAHLKYRWAFSMWQKTGAHPRMAMGIEVLWKPVFWWVNGAWPHGRGFIPDGFENVPLTRRLHPWEQSLAWAEHCLRVVPRGGLVLDPMAGAGTVLVAALADGYPAIGVECDEATCEIAARRLDRMASAIASNGGNALALDRTNTPGKPEDSAPVDMASASGSSNMVMA